MKTEYVLPEQDQSKIDELINRLVEIELLYAEKIQKFPQEERRIRNGFLNDPTIKLIQQAIDDIYMKSATKILVTLETEEEFKTMKDNWGLKCITQFTNADYAEKELRNAKKENK